MRSDLEGVMLIADLNLKRGVVFYIVTLLSFIEIFFNQFGRAKPKYSRVC